MRGEKGKTTDGNRSIATIFTYNSGVMFWSYIVERLPLFLPADLLCFFNSEERQNFLIFL